MNMLMLYRTLLNEFSLLVGVEPGVLSPCDND